MPTRARSAAVLALAAAALSTAFAGPARAAPLPPREPPFWLVVESLYAAPGADTSRGPGAGLRLGYRINDQVSTAVGFETLFARGGPVTGLSAGFEAMLDITPIAPFFELSLVRADPLERTGFSLAQRTGFGADLRLWRGFSLGAVVRYLSPLDAQVPLSGSLAGIELGLRFTIVPGAF
jgi:hypothetical protein